MTESEIAEQIKLLSSKNASVGCAAMKQLVTESAVSGTVYAHFDESAALLESENSFVRTRAFAVIVSNAARDEDDRIDKILPSLLSQISDPKPITARQCIQRLPALAAAKPKLTAPIKAALRQADLSAYTDSMRPLVSADISLALEKIG